MICQKCGKEIEENVKFCPSCGEATEQKAVKENIITSQTVESSTNENANVETVTPIRKKNRKWLIIVAVFVFAFIIFISDTGGSKVEVKENTKNNCSYFNMTYKEFSNEISDVISDLTGLSKSEIKNFCDDVSPYERKCDFCNGDVNYYEIPLQNFEYAAVAVLKIEVYTEIETDKIVWVEVFKANGSSTPKVFYDLANGVSEIICGENLDEMDKYCVDTNKSGSTSYYDYEDLSMKIEATPYNGLMRLEVYPKQ